MENNERLPPKAKPITELAEVEQVEVYEGPELIDESDLADILPSLSVNTNSQVVEEPEKCIVDDNVVLGLFDEVLENCRKDRDRHEELATIFIDMVINDGDSSSSTKEAAVNLLKGKADINDKMTKIADLMTRIKLKDKDTFPRYLAQHNNVTIEGGNTSKRDILKKLQNKGKEKK